MSPGKVNWCELTNDGNGGFELYHFLSKTAVTAIGVDRSCVSTLRCLDKTFQATVDSIIIEHIQYVNTLVSNLHGAMIDLDAFRLTQRSQVVPGSPHSASRTREAELRAAIAYNTSVFEERFGYHVAQTLKKSLHEHETNRQTQSFSGWVPKDTDIAHLSTTIHGFLSISGKQTCQLHAGGKACACSTTIGGAFSFVPNGNGLLLHCAPACIEEHSILIDPSSGTPITSRARDMNQDSNMRELAHAMCLQVGIRSPFSRDCLQERVRSDTWATMITNRHQELLTRLRHQGPESLRFMLLNHPSYEAPGGSFPTFQSLMKVSNDAVQAAEEHLEELDDLEAELVKSRRRLLKDLALRQFDRLLAKQGEQEGLSNLTLGLCDVLLPGTGKLVKASIVSQMVDVMPLRLNVLNGHVLSNPFTTRIIKLIAAALGPLKRHDHSLYGPTASDSAYGFVTGLCAGLDNSFNMRDLSAQLQDGMCESDFSLNQWKHLVWVLHGFDDMDYQSIQVSECPIEEIASLLRDYNGGVVLTESVILKFSFTFLGKMLRGPIICNNKQQWYTSKLAAGKARLAELEHHSMLKSPPSEWCFQSISPFATVYNENSITRSDAIHEFCKWTEHTAKRLCARPETRAIGIDVLTNDQPRIFFQLVQKPHLAAEKSAASAAAMQVEDEE